MTRCRRSRPTGKPKKWDEQYRLIFLRKKKPVRTKGPLQLDLFIPTDYEYDYTSTLQTHSVAAPKFIGVGSWKSHALGLG